MFANWEQRKPFIEYDFNIYHVNNLTHYLQNTQTVDVYTCVDISFHHKGALLLFDIDIDFILYYAWNGFE